jgi:hypothetical protein
MTIYDFLKELPNCFGNPQKEDFKDWVEKHTNEEEKIKINEFIKKILDKSENL